MRIGIRAHDVKYAPLDELIPNIHNQGFHCMHIALSKSIKEFKPEISTMTPGLAMYIKELCAENKVDVAVLDCDKIIVIDEGRIAACGNHDKLLKTCAIYARISSLQSGITQ